MNNIFEVLEKMSTHFDLSGDNFAPFENLLDHVEDILHANAWVFSRVTDDEIMVNVTGKSGGYRLFFIWQHALQALQFCVQYDTHVDPAHMESARAALTSINETLWMGHFDLPKDTKIPTYRYTCLFRGQDDAAAGDVIEDMVEISLAQCERYFPVFKILSGKEGVNDQILSLALMDTAGES